MLRPQSAGLAIALLVPSVARASDPIEQAKQEMSKHVAAAADATIDALATALSTSKNALFAALDDYDAHVAANGFVMIESTAVRAAIDAFQTEVDQAVDDATLDFGAAQTPDFLMADSLGIALTEMPDGFRFGTGGTNDQLVERVRTLVERTDRAAGKRLAKTAKRLREQQNVEFSFSLEPAGHVALPLVHENVVFVTSSIARPLTIDYTLAFSVLGTSGDVRVYCGGAADPPGELVQLAFYDTDLSPGGVSPAIDANSRWRYAGTGMLEGNIAVTVNAHLEPAGGDTSMISIH